MFVESFAIENNLKTPLITRILPDVNKRDKLASRILLLLSKYLYWKWKILSFPKKIVLELFDMVGFITLRLPISDKKKSFVVENLCIKPSARLMFGRNPKKQTEEELNAPRNKRIDLINNLFDIPRRLR